MTQEWCENGKLIINSYNQARVVSRFHEITSRIFWDTVDILASRNWHRWEGLSMMMCNFSDISPLAEIARNIMQRDGKPHREKLILTTRGELNTVFPVRQVSLNKIWLTMSHYSRAKLPPSCWEEYAPRAHFFAFLQYCHRAKQFRTVNHVKNSTGIYPGTCVL